jgi:hypothetical protein
MIKDEVIDATAASHDPRELRVTLDLVPGFSLLALIADALGGRPRGALPEWREALQRTAPPGTSSVLAPLSAPGPSVIPDVIAPTIGESTLEAYLDRLRGVTGDDLKADLAHLFGGIPPRRRWDRVLAAPDQWLSRYVNIVSTAALAVGPLWRRGRQIVDREVERVGSAVVRDAADVLLGSLHPNVRLERDEFQFAGPAPVRCRLNGRRTILVPMLAGTRSWVANVDLPDAVWFGYPVPRSAALLSTTAERQPDADALSLLLGSSRATVLRLLDQRVSMMTLAARLDQLPSALTYHCDRLAAMGLLWRERHGRVIWVARTVRGDALVDLLMTK